MWPLLKGVAMATKTFSGRVEESALAYADALTRAQFGVSYGQYCATMLIDALKDGAELPAPGNEGLAGKRLASLNSIRALQKQKHNAAVGRMPDDEIKALIGARYA